MTNWGGSRSGAGRKQGTTKQQAEVITLPKKQHGGSRPNAGRKSGTGKYGEPTTTLRVPQSMQGDVIDYVDNKGFNLPVYAMKVPMGLMKASIDYVDRTLNLNELIRHPDKTFFHPVEGDSMEPTVAAGDLAMIDAAIQPMHGDVVLAMVDDGMTLKRIMMLRGRIWLKADNEKYDPITFPSDTPLDNIICGVMLISIRPISKNHVKDF